MIACLCLFVAGILLSAFFSGAETGFYRVTRVRLVLDAMGGDWIASRLLSLTNNPTLFVATTLIGNNIANYLTSYAIVLAAHRIIGEQSHLGELALPVLMSPFVFVYGELLPKSIFFRAPNLLLRRCGPLFLVFTIAFGPVSAILWGMGWLLEKVLGQTPLRLQLVLARNELRKFLQEGQDAGILQPAQRQLAHGLFAVASDPVLNFCKPVARFPQVRLGTPKAELLRLVRRQRKSVATVLDTKSRVAVGYVRVVDLYLSSSDTVDDVRTLLEIPQDEPFIEAILKLRSAKEDLASVVNEEGNVIGLLYADDLIDQLFQGDIR